MSAQEQKRNEAAAEQPRKKRINMKDVGRQVNDFGQIPLYNLQLQTSNSHSLVCCLCTYSLE